MRTALFPVFVFSFFSLLALPALAQLGPAGVPGAPGLAPEPERVERVQPLPQPVPPPALAPSEAPRVPDEQSRPSAKKPAQTKVPAVCAKAKNVKRCVERQEQKRKAQAACAGKKGKSLDQCVNDYLNRRKK